MTLNYKGQNQKNKFASVSNKQLASPLSHIIVRGPFKRTGVSLTGADTGSGHVSESTHKWELNLVSVENHHEGRRETLW